jgi:probable rRNA maturation factor
VNKIELFYEDIQPLKLRKNHIKKYIKLLINSELKKAGDITVIFCSDKYLLDVNIQYLKHNYYTDIITFNYVEGNIISGDLFVSVERVIENANKFKTSWLKELYRVIFHGLLHLTGYNDKTPEESIVIRKMEDKYLSEVDFSEIEK